MSSRVAARLSGRKQLGKGIYSVRGDAGDRVDPDRLHGECDYRSRRKPFSVSHRCHFICVGRCSFVLDSEDPSMAADYLPSLFGANAILGTPFHIDLIIADFAGAATIG